MTFEWMDASCAVGTAEHCARKLQEFTTAGANEITAYGSTPGQNARSWNAWRGAFAGTSQ